MVNVLDLALLIIERFVNNWKGIKRLSISAFLSARGGFYWSSWTHLAAVLFKRLSKWAYSLKFGNLRLCLLGYFCSEVTSTNFLTSSLIPSLSAMIRWRFLLFILGFVWAQAYFSHYVKTKASFSVDGSSFPSFQTTVSISRTRLQLPIWPEGLRSSLYPNPVFLKKSCSASNFLLLLILPSYFQLYFTFLWFFPCLL
jgi:hypothetical protein